MTFKTEACIISLPEALHALDNGAHRLEICSRIETEGMTPDIQLVEEIIEKTKLPMRVMIRETEDGYAADDNVLIKMIQSIELFKKIKIDGFVFGLMKDGKIDREKMDVLLIKSHPIPITFHKAIDASVDWMDDLMWLNQQQQIDTVLTSGTKATALDGVDILLKMKSICGNKIMPGGKVTASNLQQLHELLQLEWYHGRRIV